MNRGRREFLKGAAAGITAAACSGEDRPEEEASSLGGARGASATGSQSNAPPSVSIWGQDLGGVVPPGETRSEIQIYVGKCADHGVQRIFAPGATAELVEAGRAAGVEVHPYKAVASHAYARMYPAWSANFMIPRFGTPEGRAILDAHRPIWSHPRPVRFMSDYLKEHPAHRHRNRSLADEPEPYGRMFLSPGAPEARAHEAGLFADLLEGSGGAGIQAEFVSINEDEDGASVDGYEEAIAGAFRRETGGDPFAIPNNDPEWVRFRADLWTEMVGAIREAARAVRPDALFTITVINREADRYLPAMQDWPTWVERGLADEMHLWFRSTTDVGVIERQSRHMVETVAGRCPVVAEFSCYHPGSLQSSDAMMEAARAARGVGVDGLGIYRSHAVEQLGFWPLLDAFAAL